MQHTFNYFLFFAALRASARPVSIFSSTESSTTSTVACDGICTEMVSSDVSLGELMLFFVLAFCGPKSKTCLLVVCWEHMAMRKNNGLPSIGLRVFK